MGGGGFLATRCTQLRTCGVTAVEANGKIADKQCEARPCAIDRGVVSCAHCDDFVCDKVGHLLGSREGMLIFCRPKDGSVTM